MYRSVSLNDFNVLNECLAMFKDKIRYYRRLKGVSQRTLIDY
nr:MAG TPA: hypothetical protein [Caudoviricetes sp.]